MRARLGGDVTVTDLFCGAGGSSIGATSAGAELRMAANHWRLAIETHNSNFPDAAHDCADVSQVEPRRYPRTDVLLASPECTHHSQARSNKHTPNLFDPEGDPSAERSRATMWDVVRFAEVHRYEAIIVENVVEVRRWAPFDAWLAAMDSLGYSHEIVYLNSMVAHPTPQSRDRLYVVFWRSGNMRPDLRIDVDAWCPRCETLVEARQAWKRRVGGKYRQQYVYACPSCMSETWPMAYPAASAIDWSLPCPRIGDRDRPLAAATRRRVAIGLERFGPALLAQVRGHTYERPGYVRAWPITQPTPAQTATLSHALVVDLAYPAPSSDANKVRWSALPLPTQTGQNTIGLAMPPLVVRDNASVTMPFVSTLRGGGSLDDHRSPARPLSTVTASGNHHALVVPPSFYVKNYGRGDDPSMVHEIVEPLGAVTGVDHHSLVVVDEPLDVDECGFRMLEPHEIQAAMAFPDAYVVLGTKRDRVKQLGNAVTPPAMSMLVERVLATLVEAGA